MAKKISRAIDGKGFRTLVVDIGGSGIKALVLDGAGRPLTVRDRKKTPSLASPSAVLRVIQLLARRQGRFDRVSVGFPGVVRHGMIETAQNLHEKWRGFRLAQKLESNWNQSCVRVVNDADLQGFGAISGHGVELVITLGTGFGSALFVDGQLVPNLEVALYPLGRRTYQEMLGDAARRKVGNQRWNRRLSRAIEALYLVFNYDHLYIGGGNSKKIKLDLPPGVRIVPNVVALHGGIQVWK